jgi:hypothetical protein
MKSTNLADAPSLRTAYYEISMAKEVPDAALLDEVVRRYPQFGSELTDFAILIALDALRERAGTHDDVPESGDAVSPAVSRAMSRFHNRLHAEGKTAAASAKTSTMGEVGNPFSGMSRQEFRDLAARLDTTTLFLSKLRDREIEPNTMTAGFRQYAAAELHVPVEFLNGYFNAMRGSAGASATFHKADGKPSHGARQTFEEAVRSSGMSEEQQRKLLAL